MTRHVQTSEAGAHRVWNGTILVANESSQPRNKRRVPASSSLDDRAGSLHMAGGVLGAAVVGVGVVTFHLHW